MITEQVTKEQNMENSIVYKIFKSYFDENLVDTNPFDPEITAAADARGINFFKPTSGTDGKPSLDASIVDNIFKEFEQKVKQAETLEEKKRIFTEEFVEKITVKLSGNTSNPTYMNDFVTNVVKHFFPTQGDIKISDGDKFGTVLNKTLRATPSGDEITNFQVSYAPVVGKFKSVITDMITNLDKQLQGNPTNKTELQAYKQELEDYKTTIDAIATITGSKTNTNQYLTAVQTLYSLGGTSPAQDNTVSEAITQDEIGNVMNTVNIKSANQSKIVKDEMKSSEKLVKRIMLQMKLIGRRIDKLRGTTPKSISDEDVLSQLKEKNIDLDGEEYQVAKTMYNDLSSDQKKGYATGLLGFINDLFNKSSRAFKNLINSEDGRYSDLINTVVYQVFEDQISKTMESLEDQAINITGEEVDAFAKKIALELVQKTTDRKPLFIQKLDNRYVPFKKQGSSYVATGITPYVNDIRKEILRNAADEFIERIKAGDQDENLVRAFYNTIFGDSAAPAGTQRYSKTTMYHNVIEGNKEEGIKDMIQRSFSLLRNQDRPRRGRRSENKKRKTVKKLITLIEQEIKNSNQQKLFKTPDHEVNIHTIRKQHG